MSFVASGERRPPKQAYDVYAVLGPKLDTEMAKLERIIGAELPRINAALKVAGHAEVVRSKIEPPGGPERPQEMIPPDDGQ